MMMFMMMMMMMMTIKDLDWFLIVEELMSQVPPNKGSNSLNDRHTGYQFTNILLTEVASPISLVVSWRSSRIQIIFTVVF